MRALWAFVCIALLPGAAARAADDPSWTEPFPPFKIAGNLYYVGTRGVAAYLVATPEGLILVNSNLEAGVPLLEGSIEKLGFKLSDVKILLISHAHYDHEEASATVKKLSGAKYMVMEGDVPVVESGGKKDFNYPDRHYAPAKVDRVLHDGDEVTLGGATLVAHLTAGHTRGCTQWNMKVKDGDATYDAAIVCSSGTNGYRLVKKPAYPHIVEDFEKSFKTMRSLPCDIYLGSHPGFFDMESKVAKLKDGGKNPFVDPEGYKSWIEVREKAFRDELERQKAAR